MASAGANSLRTLARPTIPIASRLQPAACFSTSNGLSLPAAVKSRRDLPKAAKKNYKKKANVVTAKKPNPGERKAFRKRIQLSNNGALAVEGLDTLEATSMSQPDNAGKVFALDDALVDQLRALEAFKITQQWNLFRKPHVLLRKETAEITKAMDEAASAKSLKQYVLTGTRLSGKSLMLLQAMSHALLNKWVVIHVPEGQDLTNGNTEFTPVPNTDPVEFVQPVYCHKLVQGIYKANKSVLESFKIEKESSRIGTLKEGATLADLVLGAKEADAAWPTLKALMAELALPGRPPLLFTLDGLAHINKISAYRDPAFNQVHSHDLLLVRTFVDLLSGKTKLPNGGAVIAATSQSNSPYPPSQELALSQLEAGQAGRDIPKPEPYERGYDDRVYDAVKNARVVRLEGASQDETRALMEYWGASGLVRSILTSQAVTEKWALAGHGNIGELERATLLTMRM